MSVCNRTPSSTEAAAQLIAEAMKTFKGEIQILETKPFVPANYRRDWIDPELKPRRKASPKPKRTTCPSRKLDVQRAARKRGNDLLRQEWPELDLKSLSEESGLHKTTILYRLGIGQTLKQATTK